jgi:hypothetical protein
MSEHNAKAAPAHYADESPEPHLKSDDSEAISGFVR